MKNAELHGPTPSLGRSFSTVGRYVVIVVEGSEWAPMSNEVEKAILITQRAINHIGGNLGNQEGGLRLHMHILVFHDRTCGLIR